MSSADVPAVLPLIITGYGAVVVLLVGACWRNRRALTVLTLAVLTAAFISVVAAVPSTPRPVTSLLYVDGFALAYQGLFLLGAVALVLVSYDYFERDNGPDEKYLGLLLFAVLGMLVLASSCHFVSFFIGLETLSVSLYGLIGYTRERPASLEASLKYLVLAGLGFAFLLMGMALVYAEAGTMGFAPLYALWHGTSPPSPLLRLGLGFMLVGFGFELAAVPFHGWAPDVYQGAPAPISALIATGSKAAMFALLIRFAVAASFQQRPATFLLLEILAIITMFGGNLLALAQTNLKRLLAYSSVAHMGYLLIPLLAADRDAMASIGFYFASYFLTMIVAFGVISVLSAGGQEIEALDDYRGLGLRRPWLIALLTLAMLSLTGIPLTVGFFAKFYILAAAARNGLWLLLIIGVLNSGLAACYYLRVLAVLYQPPVTEGAAAHPSVRLPAALVLGALAILMLGLGVYPSPLLAVAQQTASLWPASVMAPKDR